MEEAGDMIGANRDLYESVEIPQFLNLNELFEYFFDNQDGYKLHPDDFKQFLKKLFDFGRSDIDNGSAEVIKQIIEENKHNYKGSVGFCMDILKALYWISPNEVIRSIVREFFSTLDRMIDQENALSLMSRDDRYRIVMPLVKVYGMYGVKMPAYIEGLYAKQLKRRNDPGRIARRGRRSVRKRKRSGNASEERPMYTEKSVRNYLKGVLSPDFFEKIDFNKIVGGYELDLLVNGVLNIEVDGIHHTDETLRFESVRDSYLIREGIAVIRVHIEKAGRKFEDVLEELCDLVTCLVEMVLELNDIGRDYAFMSKMTGVKRLMIPVDERYVIGEESLGGGCFFPGWSDIGVEKKKKKRKSR